MLSNSLSQPQQRLENPAVATTVEPGYNEQRAFQSLNLISKDSNPYRNGEHSKIIIYLLNNDLEHSPYSYDQYLTKSARGPKLFISIIEVNFMFSVSQSPKTRDPRYLGTPPLTTAMRALDFCWNSNIVEDTRPTGLRNDAVTFIYICS